jgi:hypothetical protein
MESCRTPDLLLAPWKKMGKMMRTKILAATAAAALMVGGLGAAPASAVPSVTLKQIGSTVKPVKNPYVEQIQSRRGYRHRHRRDRWDNDWAPWVAGGLLGLGVYGLSQGLADDGYYYGGYSGYGGDYAYDYEPSGGGYARCEATFRSFDPATGTYVGYDGVRRMCPYL